MSQGARLPDFLIIGAMRAGTTTLYADLSACSEIFMPAQKEPGCLAHDDVLSTRGLRDYAWHFRRCKTNQLAGEASTIYSKLPDVPGVPQRARSVLGANLRIIYVVRDPIRRLISHHRHEYSHGLVPRDINRALREFPRLIQYGQYQMQLSPWIEVFGLDQIRVISFDRFVDHRDETLEELLSFLGVTSERRQTGRFEVHNAGAQLIRWNSAAGRFVASRLYQRYVRPKLPHQLRSAVATLLSHELPPPALPALEEVSKLRALYLSDKEWLEATFKLGLESWLTLDENY